MSHRPSSSASVRRPASSASIRPASSASAGPSASHTRPESSASVRPSSSAGSVRRSTVSSRPESRATYRPSSRHDYATSRQSSRLTPLYQSLIRQISALGPEDEDGRFGPALDYVTRTLDQTIKPSGGADMKSIHRHLRGYVQKARINSNDILATAVEDTQRKLRELAEVADLDDQIQLSRLPSHLSLLLALSMPPDSSTLEVAQNYVDGLTHHETVKARLTWQNILAEEPFEGQHWQGAYGLPPGSVKVNEDWDIRSERSGGSSSLSSWGDDDCSEKGFSSPGYSDRDLTAPSSPVEPFLECEPVRKTGFSSYGYRYDIEDLQARQYWRPEWRSNAPTDIPFNVDDASTLGPAFRRLLGPGQPNGSLVQDKYINEHDAVREVLLGLQGIENILLVWTDMSSSAPSFVPAPNAPALMHLSSAAQHSILASFAATASTIEHLRKFVAATFSQATAGDHPSAGSSHFSMADTRRSTRTLEAFAEAVDVEIRLFDQWCASQEENMCLAQAGIGPPLVVSLLSLESTLYRRFSESFTCMLDILRTVVRRSTRPSPFQPDTELPSPVWTFPDLPKRLPPAVLTSLLLDSLLLAVQERASVGDNTTSEVLVRVLCNTSAPLWNMLYRWLKDGMPIPDFMPSSLPKQRNNRGIDEEFFVEDNELALLDPDFWREGFVLCDSASVPSPEDDQDNRGDLTTSGKGSVPLFLQRISQHVLEAGKAVGLLRVLGITMFEEEEGKWMGSWRAFREVLLEVSLHDEDQSTLSLASTDDFSRMVHDELIGPCTQAEATLTRVLIDDCDMWAHLTAMEDLYLMRRGDIMSNYVDVLFARMDSNLVWDDFHFLNTSFADVVAASSSKWIDASLVRLSHRSSKDKNTNIDRTVRAIEGLFIEYAVPFPLTYIWGPKALQIYSSLFVYILQIRRAKSTLERILVRTAGSLRYGSIELKIFYAMRGRLSWFVNALLNFVCTNVLHTEILSFHKLFRKAASLDEMISLHDEHLGKLESRCLLQRNTAALHRAIMSVLDMTLHFSACFVAFAGDMTHDISRQSIASTSFHKHRSRRQRRQRRNVVGFSQTLQKVPIEDSDSSSDSEVDEDLASAVEPSFSATASMSVSFAEESFADRVGKMSSELDALVRFIRRGVESLASGTSEAASAFEVFAFALEDWDS